MSEDVIECPASPTIHLTVRLLVGFFTVIVIGSCLTKTEIVARGEGRVIPVSRLQVVQPQTSGKVQSILVTEGQAVEKGEILIMLDPTEAESDIKRIKTGINRQQIESAIARAIVIPLLDKDPATESFIEAGRAIYDRAQLANEDAEAFALSALRALRDEVRQIDAEAIRIDRSKAAQAARLAKARADNAIISRKFQASEMLRNQGTISQSDYLDRIREMTAIENEVLVGERVMDELAAEAESARQQRSRVISAALSNHRKQLNESEITLQGLDAELHAAEVRLQNTILRAPSKGRIEGLTIFTIGRFVEAGSTLMSIVPSNPEIEIEAFFDNRDIGFLQIDQSAFVKFDAFPPERFGVVKGRVSGVGADARNQPISNKWVYAVRLILTRPVVNVAGREIRFTPGMTATIDVITGERRLITYFFEPILKALQDSFGER